MKRAVVYLLIIISVVAIMVGIVMVANTIINNVQDPSFMTDPTK